MTILPLLNVFFKKSTLDLCNLFVQTIWATSQLIENEYYFFKDMVLKLKMQDN